MLKRTKMGGEIHMAQASMLSTSACFLAVRPTSTYCKSNDVRSRRHSHRHFRYLHWFKWVTGKRETFRLPGSFGWGRLFCRCVPPFLSSRGSNSSIWSLSSSVPRSSVPARWTSGQCTWHAQITGGGPAPLLCSRSRPGFWGKLGANSQTWPCREETDAQRRKRQLTDVSQEERVLHSPAVSVGWCAPSALLRCCCCSGWTGSSALRRLSDEVSASFSASTESQRIQEAQLKMRSLVSMPLSHSESRLTEDKEDADNEVEVDCIKSGRYRRLFPAIEQSSFPIAFKVKELDATFRICFCKGCVIPPLSLSTINRSLQVAACNNFQSRISGILENVFWSNLWILLARHLVSNCDQSMNSQLYKKCIREAENLCFGWISGKHFFPVEIAFPWLTNYTAYHLITPFPLSSKLGVNLSFKVRQSSLIRLWSQL